MRHAVTLLAITAVLASGVASSAQTPPPKSTLGPKGKAAPPIDQSKAAPKSKAALMDPSKLTAVAPATYKALFQTSVGDFVVEVHRDWAPKGADRFYNMVKNGFFDDNRFFRVVSGFMVQFGIHGDPNVQKHWAEANIQDDPVKQSNKRGYVTFANRGPNTRSTQVFINFADKNTFLDSNPNNFAPFGQVISGMEVVDKLFNEYGEAPSQDQPSIQSGGNKFLAGKYPKLDYVKTATITK